MAQLDRRRFLAGAAAVGAATLVGCSTDGSPSPATATTTRSAGGAGGGGVASASALDDLRRRLKGSLLLPSDAGYDAASASRNARYSVTRPIAVAEVADVDDVVTCVAWCREHGIDPVARGGGHSYGGFSTTRGLIVSLARLNAVRVDAASGRLVVGGAARNADVFAATVDGPLLLPTGTCPTVCVGGLTLGGGIGYNSHWAGLTCDRLVSTTMVTADGQVRTVSATQEPDLFWASRGGAGGSFGINTEFTFEPVPVPRDTIASYDFSWRGVEAAAAVLTAFDAIEQRAPDAFSAVAFAQATEVGPGGPGEAIDVRSRGLFIGSSDELRDLVAPLVAAAGEPTAAKVVDQGFWATQRERIGSDSPPHSWGDISRYANAPVPTAAYERQAQLLAACPHRSKEANGSMWSLGWVGGGVIGGRGRTDTAYVHRDATVLLRPTVEWPADAEPSVADELEAWTNEMIAVVAPFTPAASYQNFPNRLIADWGTQYYGENWDRLVRVKTAVDPTDVFHNGQSIPPNPARS